MDPGVYFHSFSVKGSRQLKKHILRREGNQILIGLFFLNDWSFLADTLCYTTYYATV